MARASGHAERLFSVDPRGYLGYIWGLMDMAQIHIKLPLALKRRIRATAALSGLSMQQMVVHAVESTLESMEADGLPVAPRTGVAEATDAD